VAGSLQPRLCLRFLFDKAHLKMFSRREMARPFYKNTKAGLVSKLSRRYNRIIFLTASWNFIVFKDIAVSRFNSMNGVLMYISHREH